MRCGPIQRLNQAAVLEQLAESNQNSSEKTMGRIPKRMLYSEQAGAKPLQTGDVWPLRKVDFIQPLIGYR